MTGYGKATARMSSGVQLTVEIKSLNSKGFELFLKLPRQYADHEFGLRADLASKLERGKVSVIVDFDAAESETKAANLHRGNLKAYFRELCEIAAELGLPQPQTLDVLLRLPEAYIVNENTNEKEWLLIQDTIEKALVDFQSFRAKEGKNTGDELQDIVRKINDYLNEINKNDSTRLLEIKTKIRNAIEQLKIESIDDSRLNQELVYYAEKLDIAEEKLRLKHHCDFFIATLLDKDKSNGRKLNFIAQEMGREINTIGSKANNLMIQQMVVEMKNELEKIKEQTFNLI